MDKVREVIAYQDHFENFLKKQTEKVQNKIYKVIEAIETLARVPENYLKHIKTKQGLYEARIQLGSNIWRVFCFFDDGQLVILLNGFQKKTQKTPQKEIDKASKLMDAYFEEKELEKRKKKKP
jgi:phage-related protein